jgi:hypothetical protein
MKAEAKKLLVDYKDKLAKKEADWNQELQQERETL